jgi:hypothetical protein
MPRASWRLIGVSIFDAAPVSPAFPSRPEQAGGDGFRPFPAAFEVKDDPNSGSEHTSN